MANYWRALPASAERERLTKDIAKYAKNVESAEQKLSNESFLEKAPAHIVEGLKKQLEENRLLLKKAREAAALDHERMLGELKREVGRLVVQTTANVTGKILTPEDQRRMAQETAKQIAA